MLDKALLWDQHSPPNHQPYRGPYRVCFAILLFFLRTLFICLPVSHITSWVFFFFTSFLASRESSVDAQSSDDVSSAFCTKGAAPQGTRS